MKKPVAVKDLIGRGYDGPLIGIEVEMEGVRLPRMVQGWRVEGDGSLRGQESAEYVFPEPLDFKEAEVNLKRLNLALLRNKSEVADTGYAGIHVHVNVSDMDYHQLIRYAVYYYVLEPLLLEWCGPDREGNLFCLSLSAAMAPLKYFGKAMENAELQRVATDDIRYAALNFKALYQYGSFEFRSMRSTDDRNLILKWAGMLLELREQALVDRPLDWIVEAVSHQGTGIIRTLMPTHCEELLQFEGVMDKLYEGVRNIQVFVSTRDPEDALAKWERYRAPEGKPKERDFLIPQPPKVGDVWAQLYGQEDGVRGQRAGIPPIPNGVFDGVQNEPEEDF